MKTECRRFQPPTCHDGGEVVVNKDHICSLLGHIGAGLAHGHANVCHFQSRGVVDAIAGHGHDIAALLVSLNNLHLVARADAVENMHPVQHVAQIVHAQAVHLLSGERLVALAGIKEPELLANGLGRLAHVSGDHHNRHAALLERANRLPV